VHRLDLAISLPPRTRSRVGAMHRAGTPMRAAWPCPAPPPCPAHPSQRRTDKLLRCHLHTNPLPLSASLHAYAHVCALTLSEHGRVLAATLSCPVNPGARSYKRGPSPCILFVPPPLPSSGKPLPPHCLCFPPLCRCLLPHPTSLPVRRSRSSARPQSFSQTNSNHIFTTVELMRRRPRR
jgi:hypothetical protein